MEDSTTESELGDSGRGSFLLEGIAEYVGNNQTATNTQVFSFLALLKTYVPESYLLMPECQQILGRPDPIHGGPPFEERMEPFSGLISITTDPVDHLDYVRMICPVIAREALKLLADCSIPRSTIMKKFMASHSGDQIEPHTIQFIKHLLTKRKTSRNFKHKFSSLIEDIVKLEKIPKAEAVLRTASNKFRQFAIIPQTLSRLHYNIKGETNYGKAKVWAKIAIRRAPHNSYVADTLGQIYKNQLLRTQQSNAVLNVAKKAFSAFKDVERKATNEEEPEMVGTPAANHSNSFNNRGHFGFIQVAKIVFKKQVDRQRQADPSQLTFISNITQEVIDKFDFFEWYLTYSMPDKNTLEPVYVWKDVVGCYKCYTANPAAQSTSFPGLLDILHNSLCRWQGSHAEFEVDDFKEIRDDLERTSEEHSTDVETAERYILSNIILSNKMPNAPEVAPVRNLQTILRKFLEMSARHQRPEFYLLLVLLFWPEEQQQESEEKYVAHQSITNTVEDKDEERETGADPVQLSIDLPQYVTHMKMTFDRKYNKFLRGRYLLPLFFLGQGCGLSKWVHKSRLDAILEENLMTTDLDKVIEMWSKGEVWKIPQIQDILLPIRVFQSQLQEQEEQVEVFVRIEGKQIKVKMDEPDAPVPRFVYLGFTIEGPVAFACLRNDHFA